MKVIKIVFLILLEIKVLEKEGNWVKIFLVLFEFGYVVMFVYFIRRFLFLSFVGYVFVGLKIEGVYYEFDFLRGVIEDVLFFIMNLKNICFIVKVLVG